MYRMTGKELLKTDNGVVRAVEDNVTGSFSIGLRTDKGFEWKPISETLYNLLIEELSGQQGINTL